MHKKRKGLAFFVTTILFIASLTFFSFGSFIGAVDTTAQSREIPASSACGGNTLSYTALYQMEPATYDVYVRLGIQSQKATTSLYAQPLEGSTCHKVGQVKATGKSWQKIGQLDISDKNSLSTFTLASKQFEDLPSANRPTVMLVSRSSPVCRPTAECYVKVNGKQGVLHASGTLLNEDSLHVVTAKDPQADAVVSVDYFVDNRLVYTRTGIEDFDRRWVGGGNHTVATVATYKSKQQIVISEKVNGNGADDLNYFLFTFYNRNEFLILMTGFILSALAIAYALLLIARKVYKRKLWEKTHILSKQSPNPEQSSLQSWLQKKQNAAELLKPFAFFGSIFVSVIVLIILVNTWVLQPYQVDGPSMNSTLATGEQILVNKLGKTWSNLLGHKYVPKRGEIIVFTKTANVLFEPINPGQPTFIVKRVVGLPGERVVVKKGVITVYSAAQPKGFNPDSNNPWSKNLHPGEYDRIDLTLQPDEIFVVGDNRPESIDSRANGPIKLDEIIGDAVIRVLPPKRIKLL